MRNWLKDKTVIVSGASGGIGKELCRLLLTKYAARVIGIGRSEEKMLAFQTELGEYARNFEYRLFDVSKRENWQTFATELRQNGVVPTLLVNNAGVFPTFQKALNMPVETAERVLQTNFLSVVYAVDAIAPILAGTNKDKPAIVNVSSSAALCSVVGTSAYSASKAALKGYTEALQMEEKGKKYIGIIYPGTTATELFRNDEHTRNSALDRIAMPAEKMAKKIAGVILKKKKRAVLGWDAKAMNFTAKLMPVKGLFLIRGVMKASKSKVFTEVFKDEGKNEEI